MKINYFDLKEIVKKNRLGQIPKYLIAIEVYLNVRYVIKIEINFNSSETLCVTYVNYNVKYSKFDENLFLVSIY